MKRETNENLTEYIRSGIDACRRKQLNDSDGLVGLPFEYTVPCMDETFQQLFYWDAYFTNRGLIALGMTELAVSNFENLLHLVERFGYVPNANSFDMLNRSQPPYLTLMAADLLESSPGLPGGWLERVYPVLEKEYAFWMNRRMTPCGLNRYFHHADRQYLLDFYAAIAPRVGLDPDADSVAKAERLLAEAESGWDFTPRFSGDCPSFCPVDLNTNLYLYERTLAEFARRLGRSGFAWDERAEYRKALMDRYLKDPVSGVYLDYNYREGRRSDILSAASYWPLWAGMVESEKTGAYLAALAVLEERFGITACAARPGDSGGRLQWDYPNLWPPVALVAIEAHERAGDAAGAVRLAEKFSEAVAGSFSRTGKLWEKYNAATGSTDTANEYDLPPMIGWTAGVLAVTLRSLECTRSS